MELLESWIGALAKLTEPYWLTLQALGGMIASAGAGTAIFGMLLLLLSLDLLRSSKGALAYVSRAAAIGSTLFILASFVYGDFLAAPAKAVYSAIVARAPVVPSNAVALTTLGAAGAGLIFYAGRQSAPRSVGALPPQRPSMRALLSVRRDAGLMRTSGVADFGKAMMLDPAGRLQLRQLSRNPKKPGNNVRSALRSMPASAYAARTARRIAHG